jgi:hypothetical protein
MAEFIPEAVSAGEALFGGGAEAATAATEAPSAVDQAAGASRDFNDSPVGKTTGSSFGSKVLGWGAKSYIGHEIAAPFEGGGGGGGGGGGTQAGPPTEGVNIGSWGNVG